MKNLWILALLTFPLALGAPAAGLPARLESLATTAFADIAKAKAALAAGKTSTGQSWLARAQALLKSALSESPGTGDSQSALSQAESAAAKLDPALAGKLGVGGAQSAQADAGPATATPAADAGTAVAQAASGLQGVYQKVSLARSLLKSGDIAKAKSLLDGIPSSPLDVLKGF